MLTLCTLGLLFAAIYALTIGVPSPDKRAMVSGIVAVIGVNLVSAQTRALRSFTISSTCC